MKAFEKNIRKVEPYVPGEQPQRKVIKLNTNENPYPPAPGVRDALFGMDVDKFRKYPDWWESIADHSYLIVSAKRYANIPGCTDYVLACQYLQQDGYATSPTYANTLIRTIENNKLYEYDKKRIEL